MSTPNTIEHTGQDFPAPGINIDDLPNPDDSLPCIGDHDCPATWLGVHRCCGHHSPVCDPHRRELNAYIVADSELECRFCGTMFYYPTVDDVVRWVAI